MKTIVTYVPHGIDTQMFRPITESDVDYDSLVSESKKVRGDNPNRFVVFWNNRNIHRKHPGDVILAYKEFCDMVAKNGGNPHEECLLLLHTQPVDQNGTDIPATVRELCEYPVMFSDKILPSQAMNILYNVADVTINIASNEGFGLSTAESLSAGTPIVVNVTGGLQDQCGFINPETGVYFTPDDYVDVKTLHRVEKWGSLTHGEWVKPVWPSNISLQGSVPTPYIYDDRVDYKDAAKCLFEWLNVSKDKRKFAGELGRVYILNKEVGMSRDNMCQRIIDSINECLNTFVPRSKYEILEA